MSFKSILNQVVGNENIFFQDADNNTIHIGDVIYDNATKNRTVKCPKCKTSAEDSPKEDKINYTEFICIKCGHRFFENDEIAANISSYIDLNNQEGKEFERLIEAVNHDLHVGEVITAYERCKKNKEIYGRTAQMYEWGAFTLFVSQPIDYWIDNSLRGVLAYLEKSKQLDPNSETYDRIAASIATRYFQGIMRRVTRIKNEMPKKINRKDTSPEGKKRLEEYKNKFTEARQKIFRFLLGMENCFNVYPNIDFLKYILTELYGYGGLAWFEKKISSFCRKPEDDPKGRVRLLKGYVWDFHIVQSNCEYIFPEYRDTPGSYTVKIESLLKRCNPKQEFSEVRVGSEYDDDPLSTHASLRLWQGFIVFLYVFIGIGIGVFIKGGILLGLFGVIYLISGGSFLYFKDKDSNLPDELRRLTNKYTDRF